MKQLCFLLALTCYMSYSQNASIKVTLLEQDKANRFSIFETGLNQPGGPDTTISVIELKKGKDVYCLQYISISPKKVELYNSSTLKEIIFTFKINKTGEIEPTVDRNDLLKRLKSDIVAKYGKDTASFGDYFFMMYNPNQMIQDKYVKYINILKGYIDGEVRNKNEAVFITCMNDSVPATYSKSYTINKSKIFIDEKITNDSTKVRSYLYAQMIKKNGERVKDILKESDMVFVPTTITYKVIGEKIGAKETYLINNIDFENRHNQGNEFDIVEIIKIQKVDK